MAVELPWLWKAGLSLLCFVCMVGVVSMGLLLFQGRRKYHGFQPAHCHILRASMATSPRYCCTARPSAACSPPAAATAMPPCASLIDSYSRSSPAQCRSNASRCPPPAGDNPGAWCDGGRACGSDGRGCPRRGCVLDCRACFTDSFDLAYRDASGSLVAAEVRASFGSRRAAEEYLQQHIASAGIRCLYNRRNGADVIIPEQPHDRLAVILFITSVLMLLLGVMCFLILALARHGCLHQPTAKVRPGEGFLFTADSQSSILQV